jgi:hypothetical protein
VNETHLLLRATLALYRDAARDAARALAHNVWIVALPPLYSVVLLYVRAFAGGFGIVGGFVAFLATAACMSSMLSILAEAVAHERIRVEELGQSFGRYLSSVAGILFLFWVVELLLVLITEQNPTMGWLTLAVNLGLFLVCNPLPELVYQGQRDGIGLVDEAVQFMRENAIEWLVPVAILLVPVFAISLRDGLLVMTQLGPTSALTVIEQTLRAYLPSMGELERFLMLIAASALLSWIMLFRGFLFRSLASSGRRQRIFVARTRGL